MKIIAITANSADGCMTKHEERGNAFTSAEDKAFFAEALRSFDCSVIGSGTFEAAREQILSTLTPARLRMVLTSKPDAYRKDEVPGVLLFRNASPREMVEELEKGGRRRCALLGGKRVFSQFLADGLIDEIWATLEPRIFGHGETMFEGTFDERLSLIELKELGNSVLLLKYRVLKG